MKNTTLPQGVKPDVEGVFRHIFENAFGTPISFDSAPTGNDLTPNSWGYHGTDLYIKLDNGITLKFTGTQV